MESSFNVYYEGSQPDRWRKTRCPLSFNKLEVKFDFTYVKRPPLQSAVHEALHVGVRGYPWQAPKLSCTQPASTSPTHLYLNGLPRT